MRIPPECPRCSLPVALQGRRWSCHAHGEVPPLWRPAEASYDDLADHLRSSPGFPTYLPWPLPLGWVVTDFAVVGEGPGDSRATLMRCAGATDLDGPVDIVIVTEEPGTGLGARYAGLSRTDPGPELGDVPSSARVKVGGLGVALWALPMSQSVSQSMSQSAGEPSGEDEFFDRCVFVGEADGRWLWLIMWPASAMLLLQTEWSLQDVSEQGVALVELEFGGPAAP